MSAKNLLILVDGDFVGGAETNYRFILQGLIDRGWEPIFVCPDDRNLRAYFSSLGFEIRTETGMQRYPPFSVDGRVSPLNLLRVFRAVRQNRRRVARLAQTWQARAVISNSMVSHLLNAGLPAQSGFRRVVHLHDIVDRKRAKGLYGFGLNWITRRADAIITISDAVVETIAEDARPKSVKLYNPIGKVPARVRVRDLPLRVGMFARYTPWKGHCDLMRIARACEGLPIEFVSYGNVSENDAAYLDKLKVAAAQIGDGKQVQLNGFAPDPLQEMADCDFVLHLSTSPEPFGRVLIESNACGVPVLAYRGGGVDELFDNLELVGERVENGDTNAVAQHLARAIEQLSKEPSQADSFRRPEKLLELSTDRYAASFLNVCQGDEKRV